MARAFAARRLLLAVTLVAWAASGCAGAGHPRPSLEATDRVAPYVDMAFTRTPDLAGLAAASGVRLFNLAFVTAGQGCEPTWGGWIRYDDPTIAARIRELRRAGGDVRVSFGGVHPPDLAEACTGVTALEAAYRKVVDTFGLLRVDFDVEGQALDDPPSIQRRNEAIHLLQVSAKRRGTTLRVSYSLPAGPAGLTGDGEMLLRDARARGVAVDAVNLLAMNYGPGPGGMADRATAAAQSTKTLIQEIWPGTSDAQAWRMVAITPMIGVNNVVADTFRPDDAIRLAQFAQARRVGWLSFWSINRDQPCPGGALPDRVSSTCSGINQRPGDFIKIFVRYLRGP